MRRLLRRAPPHLLPLIVLAVGLGLCAIATATSRTPWLVGTAGTLGSLGAAALLWRALLRLRQAEQQARLLAPDHERLSLLARQTSNAVVVTDLARRITWVNAGFERITGYGAAEVLGQSPGQLLQCPDTDPATVQRLREALARAEPICCELINRGRSGRLYWIEIDLQPMHDREGRLDGFIAIQSDITERKQAEAALRDSRMVLDRTARISGTGGWSWEPWSRRLQWTDETCRLLGYEPGHQPTLSGFMAHLEPGSRGPLERALAQPLDTDTQWNVQVPLRNTEGRQLWVRVRAETERDALGRLRLVGTLQDVTAVRAMRAEIQRSTELLRGAIDVIDEAFVLYDPQDRLVFCNEKYLQLYATSRELLMPGARFEDIVRGGVARGQYPAALGREEEWIAQRLQAHHEASGSGVQRLDNGRVVRIVERRMADGHRVGFRVDITDLVKATDAAEEADRAKSEFIATISHELRTPLQSVLGFSDLGRHFAAGHPQFEPMFQDIHAGGSRMLRLVNGLLDISKMDGTQGSLQLQPADLGPLLQAVLHELQPLMAPRGLRVQLPDPLPALWADVDTFRVQQVMRNVLANALRFSPEGGVLEIEARAAPGEGPELRLRDHGPGIPEDELERVFEPFLQSSRTSDGAGGTGLGLAISRRIMRAHGGFIRACAPAEGAGTVIELHWPPPAMLPAAAGPPSPRTSLRALRHARQGATELQSTAPEAEKPPCATTS